MPVGGRSRKVAKEVTSRKHVNARSWKLIRNADVNISSSIPAALTSVEDLNPLDGDRSAVVDGNPGCRFLFCVADETPNARNSIRAVCVSINALFCFKV